MRESNAVYLELACLIDGHLKLTFWYRSMSVKLVDS
jgi:hypothetical protein